MKSIWALIDDNDCVVACYLDEKRAEKIMKDNIQEMNGSNFRIEKTFLVFNEEVLLDE